MTAESRTTTRTERLAAKIAREKETLEKQRLAVAQSEAALREETRKATNKRRYKVGALADEAGLLAWEDAELAGVFRLLGALRATSDKVTVLQSLLAAATPPLRLPAGAGSSFPPPLDETFQHALTRLVQGSH